MSIKGNVMIHEYGGSFNLFISVSKYPFMKLNEPMSKTVTFGLAEKIFKLTWIHTKEAKQEDK